MSSDNPGSSNLFQSGSLQSPLIQPTADGEEAVPTNDANLGTFFGVFVPCICTLFGIVLFVQVGFIVGQAGFVWTTFLLVMGFLVSFATILSLCAIMTNKDIQGTPSLHAAVRFSIGPDLGGLVGVMFYVAYTVGVCFYTTGFAESLLKSFNADAFASSLQVFPWSPAGSWRVVAISSAINFILAGVCMFGVKINTVIISIIMVFIFICILITLIALGTAAAEDNGFTGYNLDTLNANLWPELEPFPGHTSSSLPLLFSFLFPGFVGIVGGANFSSSLKNARTSIPSGLVWSLITAFLTYFLIMLMLAASVSREALKANPIIMATVVKNATGGIPLVFIGISLTTLSSALSYFLAAPRVLRALARQSTFSFISFLGKGYGSTDEPRRAVVATWFLVQIQLFIGNMAQLAPLVSGCFLVLFCIINLTCLVLETTDNFNPSFQYYSRWTALLGFMLSVAAMGIGDYGPSAIVLGLLMVLLLWWKRGVFWKIIAQIDDTADQAIEVAPGTTPSSLAAQLAEAQHEDVDLAAAQTRISITLERAAAYIRDGLQGRYRGKVWDGIADQQATQQLRRHRLFVSMKYVRKVNMVVFVGLAFFERPLWCDQQIDVARCGSDDILTWGLPLMPSAASMVLESLCLMLFFLELYLKYSYLGKKAFFYNTWYVLQILLLCTSVAGIGMSIVDRSALTFFNPILRPLIMVSMSTKLRKAFKMLFGALPRFADTLFLVFVHIAFFSTFAVVLFDDSEQGRKFFPSLQESGVNLLILITTANFPDVMMPAYKHDRISVIFFIVFLLIGLFFLMNLVLSSIFNYYKEQVLAEETVTHRNRQRAMHAAFNVLNDSKTGLVDSRDVQMLIRELENAHSQFEVEAASTNTTVVQRTAQTDALLEELPPPAEGEHKYEGCERALFTNIVLSMDFSKVSSNDEVDDGLHWLERSNLQAYNSRWYQTLKNIVLHRAFDVVIDCTILLNAVTLIIETQNVHKDESFLQGLEPVFCLVYLTEMFLKLAVFGRKAYWKENGNRFDAIVTVISLGTAIWSNIPSAQQNPRIVRVVLLIRLLRLIRLLMVYQRFKEIFATLLSLLPTFSTLIGMMWALVYLYSAVGMVLFGGKIKISDANLANTVYGASDYYANNFNDFPSGLVTLFELLIVNNWHVIMDGFVAVTTPWHRWYFISFYIFAVVMVLNLLVAFILDAFFERWLELVQQKTTVEESALRQMSISSRQTTTSPRTSRDSYGDLIMRDSLEGEGRTNSLQHATDEEEGGELAR